MADESVALLGHEMSCPSGVKSIPSIKFRVFGILGTILLMFFFVQGWLNINFPRFPSHFTLWAQFIHSCFLFITSISSGDFHSKVVHWLLVPNLSMAVVVMVVFQMIIFTSSFDGFSKGIGLNAFYEIVHIIPVVLIVPIAWTKHHHVMVEQYKHPIVWIWQSVGCLIPMGVYLLTHDPRKIYLTDVPIPLWMVLSGSTALITSGIFVYFSRKAILKNKAESN